MAEKKNTAPVNLRYYDALRSVPQEALKTISGGRLNGMSDINPVWRIKAMTETFGPCGIGWKYEIVKQWQEVYGKEIKSYTNINLYVKVDGEWSEPIPGTGGATIVEVNSKGYMYVNDEGHKMSLTDALSVAMKSLGVAADIYFEKGKNTDYGTKYEQQSYTSKNPQAATQAAPPPPPPANAQNGDLFGGPSQQELADAFELIKQNIETAPSRQYLKDIHDQNPGLQSYPPFREALNKRYKEVA